LAAAAAQLAACILAEHPSGSSIVHVLPDYIVQITGQELKQMFSKGPIQTTPRARRISGIPLPTKVSEKGGDVPSGAVVPKCAPKQSLRRVLQSSPHDWTLTKIPRNGHCLFECIAMAFRKMNRPELPQSWKALRSVCSRQLLEWRGIIPGLPTPLVEADGMVSLEVTRGTGTCRVTLEQYSNQIATSLYGGTEELMLIAQMFNMRIHVFHNQSYTGGDPVPKESFMVNPMENPNFDVTDIYLLLETGEEGIADHHTLMIHKYAEHKELMSRAPVVDVDYCVAESDYGFGLKALKIFHPGDLTGNSFTSIIIHSYSAACWNYLCCFTILSSCNRLV
jgi:hypothetical protein